MALNRNWVPMGSKIVRGQGDRHGGDGAEADSSGGPMPGRELEVDWPTLLVEAGDSETLAELRNNMKWWFSASDNQVKIVLLAKFDRVQDHIILEKWIEAPAPSQPGASTLIPDCAQVITITRDPGITNTDPLQFDHTSYIVSSSGALRLEFDHLFLRQPAAKGEGDIIISIQDLQAYTVNFWR
ncbi:hypothetical protein B0T26DRAFT_530007 [Lasiosphaeria miniovina]|uniref:Uncharacterized protein n=1 Tax=Lasiosphaeria miniovina TaxID=1954250 RepID=A0AA40DFR1_9PEZI|nr:uncharacterized protein B0T26DRAFT_530007 [Lasiosphaeria miniovina]KAK0701779.1 hypothetical protein B0T26DRAFT_530007 [Lasiosphaeria miniovina]